MQDAQIQHRNPRRGSACTHNGGASNPKRFRSMRRIDKSLRRAIISVRELFETEGSRGHRILVSRVVKRTCAVLQTGRSSAIRIRAGQDVEILPESDEVERGARQMEVLMDMSEGVRTTVYISCTPRGRLFRL